jgi:ribosomal protein S18 acetylase RimI-like enzyme
VIVRPLTPDDLDWATATLAAGLGSRLQARRGDLIDVLADDGLVAERDDERVGLLTWRADGPGRMEITALLATERRTGVGSALVGAVVDIARLAAVREIRVTTTNDNLGAMAFYQRLGFRLVELRAGAVDEARRTIKPSMPPTGEDGLPLHDELELSLAI